MAEQSAASKPLQDLHEQVVIVTGASSGIGEAVAEQLVRRGAHVAIAARRGERLESLAERLQGEGNGETLTIQCDVREPEQVDSLVRQTLDRWGKLDILIANAGFGYRKPLVESDIHRWKAMIDTNIYGLLLTLKYGVPPMLEQGHGHVIVMSSIAGRVFTPGGTAYSATKAAATAIADSLRQEVGPRGVRVTAIEPGVVISEFQQVAEYAPEIVPNMLKGAEPLYPLDIARTVIAAIEMPAHVGLHEIVIRPTGQTYP